MTRVQLAVVSTSVACGLWYLTPSNVWPTSVGWLNVGDLGNAQQIWEYFRYTSLDQWPLAAVPSYGEGWGIPHATSSVLLIGLPLKTLSVFLPEQFQYFGLWTILNFVLQGMFSERLFYRLGLTGLERFVGSCLMLVSPVLIQRIAMTHLNLSAHWLILASVLVYASENGKKQVAWQVLLPLIALLVNLYLFVIVFTVSLAGLLRRALTNKWGLAGAREIGFQCLVLFVSSLTLWWAIGYPALLGSAQGVGSFRLNALAFLNPELGYGQSYSSLLSSFQFFAERDFYAEEGEGFAYLGIVGILGAVVLVVKTVLRQTRPRRTFWGPLVGVALLFFISAISNRIAIVRTEVQFPAPEFLTDMRQVFRATTRFSWLAYYLILVLGWVALCRTIRRVRFGAFVLVFLLFVGVADQFNGVNKSRDVFTIAKARPRTLTSIEWSEIGAIVKNMYLVPTFDLLDDNRVSEVEVWLENERWLDLVSFGAEHRLVTNFAYSGRPVTRQVALANSYLDRLFTKRILPRNSIFFFADEDKWVAAKELLGSNDSARQLDDYFIVITGN